MLMTFVSTDRSGRFTPCLSIKGTARVEEGGAPELLEAVHHGDIRPRHRFPAARRTAWVSDSHHDREGRRRRALGILTAEPAVAQDRMILSQQFLKLRSTPDQR
jgi:hypothetical protein